MAPVTRRQLTILFGFLPGTGRERLPVITLAPELQNYAEQNNVLLRGFGSCLGSGHWNAAGHRIGGELPGRKLWLEAFAK